MRELTPPMAELLLMEAAAMAGVKPRTWSSYVARGQAPAPVRRVGRTGLWDEAEVQEWIRSRPGQGSRATPRARRRAAERTAEASSPGDEIS